MVNMRIDIIGSLVGLDGASFYLLIYSFSGWDEVMREVDLYSGVEQYLNLTFSRLISPKSKISYPFAAITAQSGGTGSGKWSRPDLALVHLWKHKFVPNFNLDLYGFEVKTEQGCDVTGVHEALAHKRNVHYSYLTWHYPSCDFETPHFKTILENCSAYGVGLISFSSDGDASSYQRHLKARRSDAEADAVDDFIETRFDANQKALLLNRLGDPVGGPSCG